MILHRTTLLLSLRRIWMGLAVCCAFLASAAATAEEASLSVIDASGHEHSLAASALADLPRQKVRVKVHEADAEFAGPLLRDVLARGGVKFGDELKGRRAATIAVLEATDGYRIALSLHDIDPATTDTVAILADRRDGQPLGVEEGPYRLIVPGDKRPIRWIRMIRSIRIVNLNDAPPQSLDGDAGDTPGK